ncbi:hypothetical protein D3C85_1606150 [compost metagenome]
MPLGVGHDGGDHVAGAGREPVVVVLAVVWDMRSHVPFLLDDEAPLATFLMQGNALDHLTAVAENNTILIIEEQVGAARGVIHHQAHVAMDQRLE